MRALFLAAIAGVIAAPVAASAAIIIDDFNATNRAWPVSVPAASSFVSGSDMAVPGVIGGTRFFRMDYTDFPNPDAGLLTAAIAVGTTGSGAGVLDFATPSDRTASLRMFYFTGAMPDLESITVSLLRHDGPANQPMSVRLELDGVTYVPAQNVAAGGATAVTFDLTGVPAPVKASLSAVDVIFAPPTGGDFRLDSISATLVPEPGIAGALGGVALLSRRRRSSR